MSFKDSMQAMWDKVKRRTAANEEEQQYASNMANGGRSGYKPATAKHRVTRGSDRRAEAQQEAAQGAGEQAQQPWQPMQPTGGYPQSASYQGTGYQTNAGGYPQGVPYQGTGYQQGVPYQGTGYPQGAPYQGTGSQSAMGYPQGTAQQGVGFQPDMGQQQGASYQGTGYQPAGGYQPTWQQQPGAYAQPAAEGAKPVPDNITYLHRDFRGADGRSYRHVVHTVQVKQLSSCYWPIELMRNGESVVINAESISDGAELDHCMDFLYGATCALGCTLTRLSMQQSIYLLSPETVLVVPFDDIRDLTSQELDRRWPMPGTQDSRYEQGARQDAYPQRRYGRRSYAEPDSSQPSFHSRWREAP